jgi:hypothetical protein
MARENWTTVRIPKELHERVKEIIEKTDLGYHTVSGFINEAVRARIIMLSNTPIDSPEDEEEGGGSL